MQTDLLPLLQAQGVSHPSRIRSASFTDGALRLDIEGWRWWDGLGGDGGRASLFFTDVRAGCLDAGLLVSQGIEDDEALEDLHIVPLAYTPCAFSGTVHSVYCQEAVPQPQAIYECVHDLLVQTRAPYRTDDYLNGAKTMAGFRAMARNTNFLLAEAPTLVFEAVEAELLRQGVAHSVLTHTRATASGLCVWLGDASFLCDAAQVLWGEHAPAEEDT